MRTFNESLHITNNLRMINELFILMSQRGIDPNDFVEWYTIDGVETQNQGLLTEASEEWLEALVDVHGQPLVNTHAQPSQPPEQGQQPPEQGQQQFTYMQHVKNAATAVDALSKRMSKSQPLMDKLGGQSFQAAVVNLLHILNDPSKIAQTPQADASFSTETPSFESNGFSEFTKKLRLHNEIKTGLRTLQEHNIDPVKFVDWYVEEGQYLNEGMFDGVKDWFGRQWANTKGAFNQWGQAGNKYQIQKDQERDDTAIQQAIYALNSLKQGLIQNQSHPTEDFAAVLKQVQTVLNQAQQAPTPQAQPTAPQAQPTAPQTQPTAPQTANPSQLNLNFGDSKVYPNMPLFFEYLKRRS